MKNIHVIPTDKPSRLFIGRYRKELFLCDKPTSNIFIAGQNQNIYITSDEEIKEGDWFYVKTPNIYGGNVAAKCLGFGENCWSEHILTDVADEKGYHPSHCVKIILTTDQDLIKDGVQAIDDEFLEWFVKNPSCEDVEVELFPKFSNKLYGIVIPKEEQKQHLINMMQKDEELGLYDIFNDEKRQGVKELIDAKKQETLDEIEIISKQRIHKYRPMNPHPTSFFIGFRDGAKWQQERSYSEEEVLELLLKSKIETSNLYYEDMKEWFELNKKK